MADEFDLIPRSPPSHSHGLKESILKPSLEDQDWIRLKSHLDEAQLNAAGLEFLLGHLRRTSKFIHPYPDSKKAARRTQFISLLEEYVGALLGLSAKRAVGEIASLFTTIERGYHGILDILKRLPISRLSPAARISASIHRAAFQYAEVIKRIDQSVSTEKMAVFPYGTLIPTDDGAKLHPDAVLTGIVESLDLTLGMEARRNNWIDEKGFFVIPSLPAVSDDDLAKAGATEVLALSWRRWRRTEERLRFLGGTFEEHRRPSLPIGLPASTELAIAYRLNPAEVFDFVANERISDKLAQTLMESFTWTFQGQTVGITQETSLDSGTYVNEGEALSRLVLSELLGYDIGSDTDRPGGLSLVEWLRGYIVLAEVAKERTQDIPSPAQLIFSLHRSELLAALRRCGLADDKADVFLDCVTYNTKSRDLFDCPLIQMANGSITVFSPSLLYSNPARIVLSSLAALGEPFEQKGKAFEHYILTFLREKGLKVESFKVNRGGEEYEYDAVVVWGDYVFVFECKNHGLSSHHPVQAYYFALGVYRDAAQVRRLANALIQYPDILKDNFSVDVTTKRIIPCVLNALPYAIPGKFDDVYVTDASGLRRFFQDRRFNIKIPYELNGAKVIYQLATRPQWKADQPTPEDLLTYFEDPFQLELMLSHIEKDTSAFQVGETYVVASEEFARKETTIESFAKVAGVSVDEILGKAEAMGKTIEETRMTPKKHGDSPDTSQS